MPYTQVGMIDEHPGTGKPHDPANAFPHGRTVAVDGTAGASGLVRTEGAAIQSTDRIFEKFLAV